MGKPHPRFTENQEMTLYAQVNGLCPLCRKVLSYKKANSIQKGFQIAHIYPLNPTFEEDVLFKEEIRLSKNSNSLDNLIPLCHNCHSRYDKHKTVEEYRQLVAIKQEIISNRNIQEEYYNCSIEIEIAEIIDILSQQLDDAYLSELDYSALKIDQKIKKDTDRTLRNLIKSSVLEYYHFIKKLFADIDRTHAGKFDLMASQIKTTYLKFNLMSDDQRLIFHNMAEWLRAKTQRSSIYACEVVISFFIQSCEVFINVS